MKILICDDEVQYLDILRIHVAAYMENRYIAHEITAATDSIGKLS